ncbi:T9SS type A sorting domain-containing protein [Ekhidna sp.]|uniref:T9SS type A sorting domain-containing protein n=1 Tax=Ekhidna sp. TaxID=2608089 RepID=UPI00329A50B1
MRRLKCFVILFICLVAFGFSQNEPGCGTTISRKDIFFINAKLNKTLTPNSRLTTATDEKFIAITAHIVRQSDGTGGLAEAQLLDAIEYLNETYEVMKLNFFLVGEINYIDSDIFYDFDSSQESQITTLHNVDNTINIYFYNTLSSGNSSLCGYAYFPSTGRDHVMMANGCTVNRGSTLPHELGHYFNLYHTHGKSNTGTTDELVDGSNCATAGDDLCDTPADPNLSGKVDGGCSYTGSNRDTNGQLYSPNPRNFMSYAPGQCRELFSADQGERIVNAYENFKTYLLDKYYVADFSALGRRICEGENIVFVDESIAAATLAWEFPGGTPSTSSDEFPLVTYSTAGVYDVTLSIETESGDIETKILADYVTVLDNSDGITVASGSFETETLEEELINEDLDITFEQTDEASSEGIKSVKINFADYPNIGAEDYLLADKLLTSFNKQFQISFDYAYARYDDEYFDGLAVVIKGDCGEWSTIWEKSGVDLATAPDESNLFIPTADEWQNVSLIVQIPDEYNNTEVAFKATNGFGNNLYIDNYEISPVSAGFSIADIDVSNATCASDADGVLAIIASGSGSYEYSLDGGDFQSSNTFNSITPGDYILSVKDTDLDQTISSFASVGPDPIAYTLSQTDPSCGGDETGTIEFSASGGTGNLEINFNEGGFGSNFLFENLVSGLYSFQFRDENSCLLEGTVRLKAVNSNPSKPLIRLFSNILSVQVDANITAIQWHLDGEAIDGATRSTLANPATGAFTVEVFNEFCSSISDPYIVLATDEIKSKLIVAPNPVEDILTLQLPTDLYESVENVKILDLSGRIIKHDIFTEKIDVIGLDPGIYVISLSTKDGIVNKRFIKQ